MLLKMLQYQDITCIIRQLSIIKANYNTLNGIFDKKAKK